MAKNGFSMSNRVAVETILASTTLTKDDCGKVLIMGSASAAYTVTLPGALTQQAGMQHLLLATQPKITLSPVLMVHPRTFTLLVVVTKLHQPLITQAQPVQPLDQ